MSMEKTVCFFGIYDPSYARNRVLLDGFTIHGWRILQLRADPRVYPGFSKYVELIRQWRRVRHEHIDLVIVAFPGHTVMPLARLLFGKRVVFDAFLSLYDANVNDRGVHFAGSIAGHLDRMWDRWSCRLAHTVLLDTEAHIEYFVSEYGLPKNKFLRVFIGSALQPPTSVAIDELLVHFHGTFIPLHGIETILQAAKELTDEPLHVHILGRGQEYVRMLAVAKNLALTNVTFTEPVQPEELARAIAPAALCLGIFGASAKVSRVIPNKVYEYLALGKPILTADTPAIHELEVLGTPLPMVLVPAGDPHALAGAIRDLMQDPTRRGALAHRARAFHEAHLTPERVVGRLLADLSVVVES